MMDILSTRSGYICSFGSTTPATSWVFLPKCETPKHHTSLDMTVNNGHNWFFSPHFQTYPNIILLLGDRTGYHSLVILDTPWIAR
jgi:hypothetical protein